MKPLELHDQRHLEAAQGWFELGNHLEAAHFPRLRKALRDEQRAGH
jgi:hypothetical protein